MKVLTDNTGKRLRVAEGSSADIIATFETIQGAMIAKANLASLKVTLYSKATRQVLNGREEQSIFDENDGVVDTDGTTTLHLGAADNVVLGTDKPAGKTEAHVVRFIWTWVDGIRTRTGIEEYEFDVVQLAEMTAT